MAEEQPAWVVLEEGKWQQVLLHSSRPIVACERALVAELALAAFRDSPFPLLACETAQMNYQ